MLVEELEEMGVELAIDDFGTGHSSLSYLLAFKVHTLKIDKAFVSLIGSPKKAACVGLVDGVIDMAKSMGLSIVAEGVETQEQASYLRDRGVQMLQGYLYSRPLPVATFCQDYLIESGREIEELQELVEATA